MYTVTRDVISSFTKRKAEAICRAFQYLDKQSYMLEGVTTGFIECVAVSPFDNVNKWYFLHEYKSCKHPVKALEFYKTIFFDVLLILKMDGDDDLSFEDIREYLHKRGESLPEELM